MIDARAFGTGALGIVLLTYGIEAQSVAQYRNFVLGSDVATVAALTDVSASEAKTIHQRPALLQDLEWRPSRWIRGSMEASTDPVDASMDPRIQRDGLHSRSCNSAGR